VADAANVKPHEIYPPSPLAALAGKGPGVWGRVGGRDSGLAPPRKLDTFVQIFARIRRRLE